MLATSFKIKLWVDNLDNYETDSNEVDQGDGVEVDAPQGWEACGVDEDHEDGYQGDEPRLQVEPEQYEDEGEGGDDADAQLEHRHVHHGQVLLVIHVVETVWENSSELII